MPASGRGGGGGRLSASVAEPVVSSGRPAAPATAVENVASETSANEPSQPAAKPQTRMTPVVGVMSPADTTDKDKGVQLPPLPENSNIRIYVDKGDDDKRRHDKRHDDVMRKPHSISMRAVWSWVAGIVSGIGAGFAASVHAQDKLLEFETEVKRNTRSLVAGRGGLGAAIADSGAILPGSTITGMGPGFSSHIIEQSYELDLITQHPEKYNFARWMRRIGGKGTYTLGVGAAVGTAIGVATYAVMPADKKDKDWQTKVDSDKDQPKTLG